MSSDNTTIHIGLCADENFAMPLGVCVTSIFENNKDNKVCIHILTQGFSQKNLQKLNATADYYGQQILVYNVDDSIFDKFPVLDVISKATYLRFLFADVLPSYINKLLYLDCDVIVINRLENLYSIDISNSPFAAAEDRSSDDIIDRNRIEIFDGIYFNAGVLLMNLEYWRKNNCFREIYTFLANNPEKCLWLDQDALNILYHNTVKIIPVKYNFLISYIEPLETLRLHKSKWIGIVESSKDIVVIHYATKGKPWHKNIKHPLKCVWLYFYKKSFWKYLKLKDPRSITEKLIDFYKYNILGWPRYKVGENMIDAIEKLNKKFSNN